MTRVCSHHWTGNGPCPYCYPPCLVCGLDAERARAARMQAVVEAARAHAKVCEHDCHICHHDPARSLLCSACGPYCISCALAELDAAAPPGPATSEAPGSARREGAGTTDERIYPYQPIDNSGGSAGAAAPTREGAPGAGR